MHSAGDVILFPNLHHFLPASAMMKTSVLCLPLLAALLASGAQAQVACVSANPVIGAMQAQWENARNSSAMNFTDGFVPVTLSLLPLAEAEMRYGKLTLKSKKTMGFSNRYHWQIDTEGDYWIAADSAAWMDVIDGSNGEQALEPLTFNQGLRCAGIHKALKFHLHAGSYTLLIASEDAAQVKISAGRESAPE